GALATAMKCNAAEPTTRAGNRKLGAWSGDRWPAAYPNWVAPIEANAASGPPAIAATPDEAAISAPSRTITLQSSRVRIGALGDSGGRSSKRPRVGSRAWARPGR